MRRLVSKVQYKNFEPGEFVAEQERTCEEVRQLILDFPWAEQRQDIEIKLTSPSVVIENEKGQFLKFAPYFNGKFVLYFLDHSCKLYKVSYVRIEDHFLHIEAFFSDKGIDISEFKREKAWSHPEKDMNSQDFHYRVTGGTVGKYILSTSLINILGGIVFTSMLAYSWSVLPPLVLLLFLVLLFFTGGVLNLLLVLQYYLYAKDRLLIMSQGNDIFFFGNEDTPIQYNKNDINLVVTRKYSGSRNPLSFFAVIDIHFKDGSIIKIPNLMVDEFALFNKLYKCQHEEQSKFPSV